MNATFPSAVDSYKEWHESSGLNAKENGCCTYLACVSRHSAERHGNLKIWMLPLGITITVMEEINAVGGVTGERT